VPADYAARVRAVHESGGYGSTGCAARAPPGPPPQPRDHPSYICIGPGAGQLSPAPSKAESGPRCALHQRQRAGARRYGSPWRAAEAEKNLLRTHTTAVSTRMLHGLAADGFAPARLFSIDRVFRNEAIDRTHLAEFNQIEGARPPTRRAAAGRAARTPAEKTAELCGGCGPPVHYAPLVCVAPGVMLHARTGVCRASARRARRAPRGGRVRAGLMCDEGLTLGNLIWTLRTFFQRLGLKKLRFKPAYNPYTEPSMEIFSFRRARALLKIFLKSPVTQAAPAGTAGKYGERWAAALCLHDACSKAERGQGGLRRKQRRPTRARP